MYQNIISAITKALPYGESKAVRTMFLVGSFALLTALGALIRIPLPFTPVPITLQTFFVLLAGVMLGSKRGTLSQMVYVSAGAAGLPIFAGLSSGITLLAGPTGGFLAGFILAPSVISYLIGDSSSRLRLISALLAGTSVIFLLGNLWLWKITDGTLMNTLMLGFVPFIPGAVIKIGLVIAVVEALKHNRKDN